MSTPKMRHDWHGVCSNVSVMHKNAAIVRGSLPETASFGSMFRGIVSKAWSVIRIDIPIGYQDETGFHTGVKPAQREINWPPVW